MNFSRCVSRKRKIPPTQRSDDFVGGLSFNSALILLGALGILPPATSAMLHNLSTLGISLRSMTDLLEQKPSL